MSDTDTDAKVAAYFERPGHRHAVEQGIVDGKLPLKFAYAGSAAHTHDRLARHEGYQAVTGAAANVRETFRSAGLDEVPAIVEIGPGNGLNSMTILRRLGDAKRPPRMLLGLDFSETLLGMAEANFRRELGEVSFTGHVWDVEAEPTAAVDSWRPPETPVPVLLLGNTIGNFEQPSAALGHVRRSMRMGDTLVIGATLRRDGINARSMTEPYRNATFTEAALEPLHACGVSPADVCFTVDYIDDEVVGFAVLRRGLNILGHELPPGHRVRCFVSHRFTPDHIHSIVRAAGLVVGVSRIDEAANHIVVTAAKENSAEGCTS
ncbi:L-histidine N(alpha)-methyltransferase [Paractinoplanes rishiriensis]|uniref:Histidine-specific methyltransferase SAM-dependent domain-containing protein n=1 Tax=Paractinoplanes rishiriensis TaxID=1050105 RepID=A0A919K2I0_9ACTN|nr:L-histidine N(alpha)-methyltransferase [Actinoplanes rishiriensis]GIE99676.1 hypothetical protein Ari01nite_71410 [Actinoplanes rishiriensis]